MEQPTLQRASLKWRILLSLSVTLLVLMLLIGLASLFTLWPSYQQIERAEAQSNLLRLERVLERSRDELSVIAIDWANWDDTYSFLEGENPRYLNTNMVALTFTNASLYSILLYDLERRPIWGGVLDERNNRLLPAPQELIERMAPELKVDAHGNGFTALRDRVYLYAWTPVTDSNAVLPANGYLVMLRPLDNQMLGEMRELLNLSNLDMQLVDHPVTGITHRSSVIDGHERINLLRHPLTGLPQSLRLSFNSQRAITHLASASMYTSGVLIATAMLCCLLVIYWQLQKQISLPLSRLAHGVTRLGEDADSLRLLDSLAGRRDEVGTVTREIREMHLRILSLSNIDPLTGLPNRRQFDQALTEELHNASRAPFSLCFIDLDGFKPVNDQFGHETGDHLLQELARRMSALLRDRDTLARIGGDEFVLVLDGVYRKELVTPILERLLNDICQIEQVNGHRIQIGASIGVACFPRDASDIPGLLQRADLAMYQSKQQGGGRITFAAEVTGTDIADSDWVSKRHLYNRPLADNLRSAAD